MSPGNEYVRWLNKNIRALEATARQRRRNFGESGIGAESTAAIQSQAMADGLRRALEHYMYATEYVSEEKNKHDNRGNAGVQGKAGHILHKY